MKAPDKIPSKLYKEFTMNGKAALEFKYANDCSQEVQDLINANFTQEIFEASLTRVQQKEQNYYGHTDTWLYEALEKYPIRDKDICLMGSTHPWYEAMVIAHGAKSCSVIEYSKRETFHEKIVYLQPDEVGEKTFDASLSISSYEHDGLGRYGDPLNPNGDIEAMAKTKTLIKKDGLLYLAVPIGRDKVVFNVHRVYGRHRIDQLLEGWETVEQFGFFENSFDNDVNGTKGSPYQPLYILKNI
tara:strand:+ start:975 stop:1703 length:729 start_codon:yes stop_codon:yes gene_type:complete